MPYLFIAVSTFRVIFYREVLYLFRLELPKREWVQRQRLY